VGENTKYDTDHLKEKDTSSEVSVWNEGEENAGKKDG
jgi:hypothetical protein